MIRVAQTLLIIPKILLIPVKVLNIGMPQSPKRNDDIA